MTEYEYSNPYPSAPVYGSITIWSFGNSYLPEENIQLFGEVDIDRRLGDHGRWYAIAAAATLLYRPASAVPEQQSFTLPCLAAP